MSQFFHSAQWDPGLNTSHHLKANLYPMSYLVSSLVKQIIIIKKSTLLIYWISGIKRNKTEEEK